ncbi:uncharacterized protein [Nothobranchius furzeri]|uniref:Transcript variant X1 n=2 Tax=Nothobranchius furzeri TaxID=105023 RepID=A0A9D3BLI4_NOTFU|nr:transcript variant X1 [Nothobranchius furzeri]KAF7214417.1 transcript variant X2 [Nothobranchius furzeri]
MKLELVLMLAVAALAPSLSDSRIVSVCELKDKLGQAIPHSGKPQKHELKLARIVCELKRMSNLNTSLVIGEGNRQPKTTNKPLTSPRATGGTHGPAGTVAPTPFAADNSTAAATGAASATTASVTASAPVSTNATTPSGIVRQKRSAKNRSGSGNKEKNRDDSEEKEKEEDSSQEQEDSSDDDDDDDSEEGTYGIFQLSDGHACESGYRPSRNQCRTDCSAFTDDDIEDDIKCFVGRGYWRSVLEDVSGQCGNPGNIFSQCS